jgi:glycosyltransferase involved in cell wall biosynthesis
MSDEQSITVVIATLGGESLVPTIERLNQGSIRPAEILVCIPEREASLVVPLVFDNVRVVPTPCRGQVAQRAFGFQQAKHGFVMQLDDDMFVDPQCLERLLAVLVQLPDCAAAPALVNVETNESVYKKPASGALVGAIYYWLMNGRRGYREGEIEKSGSPVGVDPARRRMAQYEVEWLAGGCVLHRKENLVLENFYPFMGKAFSEDIIHSFLLRQRNIRLLIVPQARCGLELVSPLDSGWEAFWKEVRGDFQARSYFMDLSGHKKGRMYLFYVLRICRYIYKRIVRWARPN